MTFVYLGQKQPGDLALHQGLYDNSVPSTRCTFFFTFWPCQMTCGILVPQPGIKPGLSASGAQSLNQWTTRKVPVPYSEIT